MTVVAACMPCVEATTVAAPSATANTRPFGDTPRGSV